MALSWLAPNSRLAAIRSPSPTALSVPSRHASPVEMQQIGPVFDWNMFLQELILSTCVVGTRG